MPNNPTIPNNPIRRRRVRIIALILLMLFLLVAIAIQIILWTDLPRNLVVSAVENQLGLRMTARSLSTGWLGNTELRDVTISLPLAEHALLTVPTMDVKHTSLPWLLLTRSLTIDGLSLDHPSLFVTQSPRGQWSILEVLELLARAGGAKSAEKNRSSDSNPSLPALHVTEATLIITDARGHSATLWPLNIDGTPQGPLVWRYNAQIPDHLDLTGKVAPGASWSHQVNVKLANFGPWLAPWIGSYSADASLAAEWSGQYYDDQLAGHLDLNNARYGPVAASGTLDISTQATGISIRPRGLSINPLSIYPAAFNVNDGELVFTGLDIQAHQLAMAVNGGHASVEGKYVFAGPAANIEIAWRDIRSQPGATQSGSLSAEFTNALGQTHLKADLQSQGAHRYGVWDAQIAIDAAGQGLRGLSSTLTARRLRFTANNQKEVDLSGLSAVISPVADGLSLQSLTSNKFSTLGGRGGYTFADGLGWLTLDGRALPVSGNAKVTADLDFNAWIKPGRAHLTNLYLRAEGLGIFADADYLGDLPKPLAAHLYVTDAQPLDTSLAEPRIISGTLRSQANLKGTLWPLDLAIDGNARGLDLWLRNRSLGNFEFALAGRIQNERMVLAAKAAELLGGSWEVEGFWPVDNALLRLNKIHIQHVSLRQATNQGDLSGTLDADLSMNVKEPRFDAIDIEGNASISGMRTTRPVLGEIFTPEKIDISRIQIRDGVVQIDPIKLAQGDGSATVGVYTTVAHPTQWDVNLEIAHWPVRLTGVPVSAIVSTDGRVDLNIANQSGVGSLNAEVQTMVGERPLARVQSSINIDNRTLAFTSIKGNALDGALFGDAIYALDDPMAARASLDFSGIQLKNLAQDFPRATQLAGTIEGSLRLARASEPRALEPLSLRLKIHPNGVRIHAIPLGDFQMFSYLGPHRFVLDDSPDRPSRLAIASGDIGIWGRVTRHESDLYQSLMQFDFHDLNLQDLIGTPAHASTPGLLSGQFTVIGKPSDLGSAFGQGRLTIKQSDLAGAGPIAFLYNLMNIGHDPNKPVGYGTIDLRLQDNAMEITAMHYFDRGTEVRLSGAISNILAAPASPIIATAVGSARPLASLDLPGLGDIDGAFSVIQQDSISVQIGGTLASPTANPIAFGNLTEGMRQILLGDARNVPANTGQ
ncbi:MAG: AsmA family protein [Planctomycetota bacterium]|nr:AsmA family protein [Planctomycetota bacterium]